MNLQCDIDHPTQTMADLNHLLHTFGGIKNLKGKKLAMTWAYSHKLRQAAVRPAGRHRPDDASGHGGRPGPSGGVRPDAGGGRDRQKERGGKRGGNIRKPTACRKLLRTRTSFTRRVGASFAAMEKRTDLYGNNDMDGIKALEKELLKENAQHKDWECTEDMMKLTKEGKALYLHCLPADITGVSCEAGEVAASVFDRYRVPLYKQASHKPYVIAAMIFLAKIKDPQKTLETLIKQGTDRHFGK